MSATTLHEFCMCIGSVPAVHSSKSSYFQIMHSPVENMRIESLATQVQRVTVKTHGFFDTMVKKELQPPQLTCRIFTSAPWGLGTPAHTPNKVSGSVDSSAWEHIQLKVTADFSFPHACHYHLPGIFFCKGITGESNIISIVEVLKLSVRQISFEFWFFCVILYYFCLVLFGYLLYFNFLKIGSLFLLFLSIHRLPPFAHFLIFLISKFHGNFIF